MAGDWIKVEVALPDKPEVIGIATALSIDQDAVVGKLLRLWIWADAHTVDGNAPNVTETFIDRCTFVQGFGAAMKSVGWLIRDEQGVKFPNFTKHNGQTSKQRLLTAKRVAGYRGKSNAECNGHSVTETLPQRDLDGEGEVDRDLTNRKDTDREVPSTLDSSSFRKRQKLPPLDLSHLSGADWAKVIAMAEKVAKRITVRSDDDRRAWLRYAVLAVTSFSEVWLMDAAKGASETAEVKKSRQAMFVRALQNGVKETADVETFNGMSSRIEIPDDIWKSNILEVKGK